MIPEQFLTSTLLCWIGKYKILRSNSSMRPMIHDRFHVRRTM